MFLAKAAIRALCSIRHYGLEPVMRRRGGEIQPTWQGKMACPAQSLPRPPDRLAAAWLGIAVVDAACGIEVKRTTIVWSKCIFLEKTALGQNGLTSLDVITKLVITEMDIKMLNLETYARPSVAVDLAIMTVVDGELKALLVDRPDDDVPGWAMPGGFVWIDQSLEQTVERVLIEKVGLPNIHFEQLASYGAIDRDPRGRVISIVYLALCPSELLAERSLCTIQVDWTGETGGAARAVLNGEALNLAFDHAEILGDVVKRLRGKLDYSRIGYDFLPGRFTLREVQEVHEAIQGKQFRKPPFRRKLLDRGMIVPTGEFETGGAYRPAELYEVKPEE